MVYRRHRSQGKTFSPILQPACQPGQRLPPENGVLVFELCFTEIPRRKIVGTIRHVHPVHRTRGTMAVRLSISDEPRTTRINQNWPKSAPRAHFYHFYWGGLDLAHMQSQAGWKYPAQFCYLGVSYRTKHSRYNCKLNLFQLKMLFFDWFRVSGHLRTVFVTEAWNLFFLKKSMQSVCRNYCLSLALIFFLGGTWSRLHLIFS